MGEKFIKFMLYNNTKYFQTETSDGVSIIKNNADSSKYIEFQNYRFYNSAYYYHNNSIYGFLIVDTSGDTIFSKESYNEDMSESTTYTYTCNYNTGSGDIYCCTPSNSNNIYYTKTWNNVTSIVTQFDGIPVFTDLNEYHEYIKKPKQIFANGGGATHIAKVTGQLSTLSSNLSDILIVSGGGGGGMIFMGDSYAGADAGGISGSGSNSGNQSTGYAFGLGEAGTNLPGGGAGFYGGYKGVNS